MPRVRSPDSASSMRCTHTQPRVKLTPTLLRAGTPTVVRPTRGTRATPTAPASTLTPAEPGGPKLKPGRYCPSHPAPPENRATGNPESTWVLAASLVPSGRGSPALARLGEPQLRAGTPTAVHPPPDSENHSSGRGPPPEHQANPGVPNLSPGITVPANPRLQRTGPLVTRDRLRFWRADRSSGFPPAPVRPPPASGNQEPGRRPPPRRLLLPDSENQGVRPTPSPNPGVPSLSPGVTVPALPAPPKNRATGNPRSTWVLGRALRPRSSGLRPGPASGNRDYGQRGGAHRIYPLCPPQDTTTTVSSLRTLRHSTTGSPDGLRPPHPQPRGGAGPEADKNLDRGLTFNGSQRWSCSATHETPTQNQVVYESFSTGFSTNLRCDEGERGDALSAAPRFRSRTAFLAGPPGGEPAIRGQSKSRGAAVSFLLGGILT